MEAEEVRGRAGAREELAEVLKVDEQLRPRVVQMVVELLCLSIGFSGTKTAPRFQAPYWTTRNSGLF